MAKVTVALIIGWSITGVGIAVSLCWNLANTFHSNRLAKRLRIEQYRLSQWERIRAKIDKALDDLVEASRIVVEQARKLESPDEQLDIFNVLMVDAQDSLASALEEASRSEYCIGEQWCDAANGRQHGIETSWDLVLQCVVAAQAATERAERVRLLSELRQPVGEIRETVKEVCRVQDRELDPNKL